MNIRSIKKNSDEFIVMMESLGELKLDVICLSETWQIHDDSNFNISDYNLIHNRGVYNQNDGMIMYKKRDHTYTYEIVKLHDFYFLIVHLIISNKKIKVHWSIQTTPYKRESVHRRFRLSQRWSR